MNKSNKTIWSPSYRESIKLTEWKGRRK